MAKYVDVKVESWIRWHFDDNRDMSKIIQMLETGIDPFTVLDEVYPANTENLYDTEQYITPKENDNQPTIEVYEGDQFQECIWDNVNGKHDIQKTS